LPGNIAVKQDAPQSKRAKGKQDKNLKNPTDLSRKRRGGGAFAKRSDHLLEPA